MAMGDEARLTIKVLRKALRCETIKGPGVI